MNIPLLRQIQAQIIQHPETLYMPSYDCGTTACIAGWACKISGVDVSEASHKSMFEGQRLIGLSSEERGRLFCENWWPEQFRLQFGPEHPAGCKARAKAAVARIDHFIATDGKE